MKALYTLVVEELVFFTEQILLTDATGSLEEICLESSTERPYFGQSEGMCGRRPEADLTSPTKK